MTTDIDATKRKVQHMTSQISLHIEAWSDGERIPARYALGKQGDPADMSDNISPAISWTGVPDGTKSFVVLVTDPDVPSAADDVNVNDRQVPSDLPRVDFYHWVLVDQFQEGRAVAEHR